MTQLLLSDDSPFIGCRPVSNACMDTRKENDSILVSANMLALNNNDMIYRICFFLIVNCPLAHVSSTATTKTELMFDIFVYFTIIRDTVSRLLANNMRTINIINRMASASQSQHIN